MLKTSDNYVTIINIYVNKYNRVLKNIYLYVIRGLKNERKLEKISIFIIIE
mgnify:CR=1 FL=1